MINNEEFNEYLFEYWKYNFENLCNYCTNYRECKSKDCEKFEDYGDEGYLLFPDCSDSESKIHRIHTTCMDLDYGTCPLLSETPCKTCIEDIGSGFSWNGVIPDEK